MYIYPSLTLCCYDAAGMFFQWVVCIGIWIVGLVVNMARNQPPLFLPSIVGGVFWCTGKFTNLIVVVDED